MPYRVLIHLPARCMPHHHRAGDLRFNVKYRRIDGKSREDLSREPRTVVSGEVGDRARRGGDFEIDGQFEGVRIIGNNQGPA